YTVFSSCSCSWADFPGRDCAGLATVTRCADSSRLAAVSDAGARCGSPAGGLSAPPGFAAAAQSPDEHEAGSGHPAVVGHFLEFPEGLRSGPALRVVAQ